LLLTPRLSFEPGKKRKERLSAARMMANPGKLRDVLEVSPRAVHGFMDFEGMPFMRESGMPSPLSLKHTLYILGKLKLGRYTKKSQKSQMPYQGTC